MSREEQEERMRILTEQILVLRKQVRILTQDSPLATHVYPSTQGEWSEVKDWKDWKEHPWRSCQSHHQVFPTLPEQWTLNILITDIFPAGSPSMPRNWEWTIYFCRIRLIPLTLLQSREKRSVMTKTKVTKKLNRRLCRCTATGPVF